MAKMKKNYKTLLRMSNSVEPAAPASVWGKGCAGKGGKTTNFAYERKDEKKC